MGNLKRPNSKVLLLIDQRARDSISILLLYYNLKSACVKVILCNKRNLLYKYNKYNPSIVILSDTGTYYSYWCRYMNKNSKILLMPQEGAIPSRELAIKRYIMPYQGSEAFLKGVTKVFLWGSKTAEWLQEAGVFKAEQIVVAGTPRFDYYLYERPYKKEGKFTIGIANRGDSINSVETSVVQQIDIHKYNTGDTRFYTGKNNWEDWMWHAVAQLRLFFVMLDKIKDEDNINVIFRADPYENSKSYEFLEKKYKKFIVDKGDSLNIYFNKINLLVTEFSTTGIEALINNIPVVSIQKLLGERLREHNSNNWHVNPGFLKYYWLPETIDELISLLKKFQNKELNCTPDQEGINEYLKDFYDIPRTEYSFVTITNEIIRLLKENEQIKDVSEGNISHENEAGLNFTFINTLKPLVVALIRGRFKQLMRKEYNWWQRKDYRKAKSMFESIKKNKFKINL